MSVVERIRIAERFIAQAQRHFQVGDFDRGRYCLAVAREYLANPGNDDYERAKADGRVLFVTRIMPSRLEAARRAAS